MKGGDLMIGQRARREAYYTERAREILTELHKFAKRRPGTSFSTATLARQYKVTKEWIEGAMSSPYNAKKYGFQCLGSCDTSKRWFVGPKRFIRTEEQMKELGYEEGGPAPARPKIKGSKTPSHSHKTSKATAKGKETMPRHKKKKKKKKTNSMTTIVKTPAPVSTPPYVPSPPFNPPPPLIRRNKPAETPNPLAPAPLTRKENPMTPKIEIPAGLLGMRRKVYEYLALLKKPQTKSVIAKALEVHPNSLAVVYRMASQGLIQKVIIEEVAHFIHLGWEPEKKPAEPSPSMGQKRLTSDVEERVIAFLVEEDKAHPSSRIREGTGLKAPTYDFLTGMKAKGKIRETIVNGLACFAHNGWIDPEDAKREVLKTMIEDFLIKEDRPLSMVAIFGEVGEGASYNTLFNMQSEGRVKEVVISEITYFAHKDWKEPAKEPTIQPDSNPLEQAQGLFGKGKESPLGKTAPPPSLIENMGTRGNISFPAVPDLIKPEEKPKGFVRGYVKPEEDPPGFVIKQPEIPAKEPSYSQTGWVKEKIEACEKQLALLKNALAVEEEFKKAKEHLEEVRVTREGVFLQISGYKS